MDVDAKASVTTVSVASSRRSGQTGVATVR